MFQWVARTVAIGAVVLSVTSATAQVPCVGDCNANGVVAINELIIGVNIALGNRPATDCPSFDSNGNGAVAVNELVQAVNAALQGCEGSAATPTPEEPTATSTPEGPTATPTSTPDVETVAGASVAVANSLASIGNVVGAIVTGVTGAVGGGTELSGVDGGGAGADVDACELGGTVTSNVQIVGLTANVTVDFDNCEISRPDGSILFDGLLTVTGLNLSFQGAGSFVATLSFKDLGGEVVARTVANIQSPVALTVVPGGTNPCAVNLLGPQLVQGVDMTSLVGTLTSEVIGQGVAEVTFQQTSVDLTINESGDDCVPTDFDILFDGPSQISQSTTGGTVTFDLEFVSFLLSAMQSGAASLVSMAGDLIAECFGGSVTLSTPQNLSFLLGQFCPGSGTLTIEDLGDILYSDGGVTVGGMSFESCLDPALLTCVE